MGLCGWVVFGFFAAFPQWCAFAQAIRDCADHALGDRARVIQFRLVARRLDGDRLAGRQELLPWQPSGFFAQLREGGGKKRVEANEDTAGGK